MVPDMKPSLFPSRSLGAREVRALAHPLRLRMLESLHDGPATASMLARELGESSGATSYHLRALAAAGLIVEDLDRRKGRERWWKREPSRVGLISSAPAEDPEYDAAVAQLESTMLGRDEDAIRRYIHSRGEGEHSDEWRETAFIGGWMVYATQRGGRRALGGRRAVAARTAEAGGGARAGHAARLRHLPRAAPDTDRRVRPAPSAIWAPSRTRRPAPRWF